MTAPRIGITGTTRQFDGAPRSAVNAAYVQATLRAGGIPLVLPPVIRSEDVPAVVDALDGVLLTGGEDVDPRHFNEAPHPKLGSVDPDRDRFEFAILKEAWERRMPVLAICRGIQVVNVAFGGSLWQDIPSQRPSDIVHNTKSARDQRSHAVALTPGSRVARALGAERIEVNSFHHQSIKDLAKEFVVTGLAPDGEIEAIESVGDASWLLAVQWHPEEFHRHDVAPDHGLFGAFLGASRGVGAGR
ncbi:MAG TPA: gamma-glutamyl-gamma-aminobutyrate hydrolase family protein [Gemmatimonadales bacterium]|nr:gamma-glutamyl-gamma-aminobutyrate hydrolase family protein [Gemmatimonadales bacterium]